VEAPHKHRAKERVSQLEERYGLSHRESFALLASTRSGAAVRDKSEWKTFVTEVWGQIASPAAPKPPSGGTVTVDGVVDMLAEIYRRPENQHPRGIRPGSAAEKEGNMSLMNSLSDIQSHTIGLVPAEGGFLVYDGKSTNATHVPQLEGTKICLVEARAMVHLGNLRQRVLSETLLAGGLVDMAKLPDLADQALTALRRSGRTDGLALIRCESSGPLPLPPVHDLLVFLHSLKETQDSTRE